MDSIALDKCLDANVHALMETYKEERMKSVVSLQGIGMAPESISTLFCIAVKEALRSLLIAFQLTQRIMQSS
jgi:hypothetical protein